MSKEVIKIGVATPEQIAEWKKKHGDVFKVEVGNSVCYLKKPDRKTIRYMASVGNDPIRANEVLLENCWLSGNEAIKTNDELFLGVSSKLAEILEIKEAEIAKL